MNLPNRKTVKTVAISAAIGLGVGAAVTAIFVIKGTGAHILKEAKWLEDGAMSLSFYHRDEVFIIPKP